MDPYYQYSYPEYPPGTVYYVPQPQNYPVYQYQGYMTETGPIPGQFYPNDMSSYPHGNPASGLPLTGYLNEGSEVPAYLAHGGETQTRQNLLPPGVAEDKDTVPSEKPSSKRYSNRGHRHANSRATPKDNQSNFRGTQASPAEQNQQFDDRRHYTHSNQVSKTNKNFRDDNNSVERRNGTDSRQNPRNRVNDRQSHEQDSGRTGKNYGNSKQRSNRPEYSDGNFQNGRQFSGYKFDREQDSRRRRNDQYESRQRYHNPDNQPEATCNLTDEEKERLGIKFKSSNSKTTENNSDHKPRVKKVETSIGSRSSNHGDRMDQDTCSSIKSPEVETKGKRSDKKNPRSSKQKETTAGNSDQTQRESYVEQLRKGSYECMVCCCDIRCDVAVWSCGNCYHIFHLYCIKKWARSPSAIMEGGAGWRCPSCQNPTDKVPNQYKCFCGKRLDPNPLPYETPHSCGDMCGRKKNSDCPHSCNIPCHPGACPPCEAMVNKTCACGKTRQFIRCLHASSFRCDKVCGKELNCAKHTCQTVCHQGPCEPCQETIVQECYGKHTTRVVTCGSEQSLYSGYMCEETCDSLLDCGNHRCEKLCHDGPCGTCQRQPSMVSHCPCGKTELSTLTEEVRQSCLDPVPLCHQVCGKPLTCGPPDKPHLCEKTCHEGTCGPCQGSSSRRCRCGALEKELPCEEAKQYTDTSPYLCEKKCSKKRMCKRHKCNQPCCVAEEHICEIVCGRKLACGLHKCEHLCHRGNCAPCLQASFTELTCHCGAAILHPPVACGTRPPECTRTCTRVHPCGHKVTHRCHSDADCPPCTVLTEKWCMGRHELRKNIPCHLQDVSCGLPCNKPLPCGQHRCKKICHKGGCLEESESCTQLCPLPRADCGHPCNAVCHANSNCPKSQCKTKVVIKCKCGSRSATVICASGGLHDITDFQKMATANLATSLSSLQRGQSVDISELAAVRKTGVKQLDCDKDCAVIERNKRLALALEIKNPDLAAKLGNPPYSQFLKDIAKKSPQLVSSVEKALSDLVQSAKQSKQAFRRHAFPPMNMNQRRMVHELAEFYGCETESYDQEPKKNVVATANRDKCWLPSVTLTSLVQRELQPKAPLPIPHKHSETELRATVRGINRSTDVYAVAKKTEGRSSPVVDYFDMTD